MHCLSYRDRNGTGAATKCPKRLQNVEVIAKLIFLFFGYGLDEQMNEPPYWILVG